MKKTNKKKKINRLKSLSTDLGVYDLLEIIKNILEYATPEEPISFEFDLTEAKILSLKIFIPESIPISETYIKGLSLLFRPKAIIFECPKDYEGLTIRLNGLKERYDK